MSQPSLIPGVSVPNTVLVPVRDRGSVHDSPGLPPGFEARFRSVRVGIGALALHTVVGGEGPPLLLLCGWPQTWYAWRELMPALADRFSVIVPDPRGVGLSDSPADGYDTASLANDMFALMSALGHERFAVVGHDVGLWTAYAMAADRPERIVRLALGEARIPGVGASPPLLPQARAPSDRLWHFNFNRARDVNERLVAGREEIYFGHQFETKAGHADAVSAVARAFYIEMLRDPARLRASFEVYRALDLSIPQNRARSQTKLSQPVLAFAGALGCGDTIEQEQRDLAHDVTSVIFEDCGHYPADEQPAALLAALSRFLEPYAAQGR